MCYKAHEFYHNYVYFLSEWYLPKFALSEVFKIVGKQGSFLR